MHDSGMMQDLALDLLRGSFIYQIGDHLKNHPSWSEA